MEKKFEFKPFDKVLVKSKNGCPEVWSCDMFSHYEKVEKDGDWVALLGYSDLAESLEIIPFEGNEHLLGTTDPYEPPYEPKRGDFVTLQSVCPAFLIYKGEGKNGIDAYAAWTTQFSRLYDDDGLKGFIHYKVRPSTDEEKEILLNALHEAGKDWDAERMEIVEYKWMPKEGKSYYRPTIEKTKFIPYQGVWCNMEFELINYKKGWIFKTKEKCQELCDKLNEAIKNIK